MHLTRMSLYTTSWVCVNEVAGVGLPMPLLDEPGDKAGAIQGHR